MSTLTVIGGGLAGCEAAWQAAERGVEVRLVEMRPASMTPAHRTGDMAELVCSNSLGTLLPDRATGVLHAELEALGSLLRRCAGECAVPAGGALAVDRMAFSERVSAALNGHARITIERTELKTIPEEGVVVLATGPLTSPDLAKVIAERTGEKHLYFYDAIAPMVRADSLEYTQVFRASRYDRGVRAEGDYLNGPMDAEQYAAFIEALRSAERVPLRSFESDVEKGVRAGEAPHFEGCLPIEVLASRGEDAPAFGPLRPVGLTDPKTGRRPKAVVQLRQEDEAGDYYSLVGFQTQLRRSEQERVFRMIPGLARAVFERYGQLHRNTFLNGPRLLEPTLQWTTEPRLFVAGQLAGFEGYAGSIATGLVAGWNAARRLSSQPLLVFPPVTMIGALLQAVAEGDPEFFQPVKANFGLLPPLPPGRRLGKRDRAHAHAKRAEQALAEWRACTIVPFSFNSALKNKPLQG